MQSAATAKHKRDAKEYLVSILFILPSLCLLFYFVIVPTLYTMKISLFRWDGINPVMTYVGTENYRSVFTDPKFHTSILNNFIWAVMHIVIACGAGFVIAYLISRIIRGKTFFRNIFFLPNVIALSVCGVIWSLIYNPQMGVLNQLLELFHLSFLRRQWLGDPSIAIYSISVASSWQAYGYYMTLFLAGLQNIDVNLYEASELDGAGQLKQFWYVTIPGLRSVFTFVLSMAIINGLKGFASVWSMTQGGPGYSTYLLTLYGYVKAFQEQKFGPSMVSGVTLAVMIVIITVLFNYLRDRKTE